MVDSTEFENGSVHLFCQKETTTITDGVTTRYNSAESNPPIAKTPIAKTRNG